MKKYSILIVLLVTLISCNSSASKKQPQDLAKSVVSKVPVGTLDVVVEMQLSPGNLAVSNQGRLFTSIHPTRKGNVQLLEIVGDKFIPFPNKEMQSTATTTSNEKFDTPLGIVFDNKDRLWLVDVGLNIGKTRVFAYDINTKEELYRFDVPEALAPNTGFVQDLAIDEINDFVYLADAVNTGIIVIDIKKQSFRKIVDLPSMQYEDIDMVIDNKVQHYLGNPIRISVDPITISKDRETLYYGAMNSTKWYKLPTKIIREDASDEEIIKQIALVGEKPICDGAATDDEGNHYFTNVQEYSISKLSKNGTLSTLKQHAYFDWPDNIRIYKDWLYITSNQINKTVEFTGTEDLAIKPYRILKLKFK
ncbi:L-dopachrome tautomerase-related protein [Maribacter sp. BPC-D8]|uniref:L-dopachrome tautomerase-related protein n=1 Tax=Maribacter sp. BPC-D8 TaxID=3053613 RepID=UPI002B496AF6|nr:L-dopachrome tautomerase-related protein [Maribacter sp. BPC-D8]WRI30556.1 L-dopachrome tautomerase-related protein [Maribacter sp. BPC-D8]